MAQEVTLLNEVKILIDEYFYSLNKNNFKDSKLKLIELITKISLLINLFDKDTIENLKNNYRNVFLVFLPNLKDLLENLSSYTLSLNTSFKTLYTEELSSEIVELNQKLIEFTKNNNLKELLEKITEKEHLELEYNKVKSIVTEKEVLLNKVAFLNSLDINNLNSEILVLEEELKSLEALYKPTFQKKKDLEEKLNKHQTLRTELTSLQNKEEVLALEILEELSSFLEGTKNTYLNWDKEKVTLLTRLEKDFNKYKDSEAEMKSYLSDLSTAKEAYLKNKAILEKHFATNVDILESLPNLNNSLKSKVHLIENELKLLDKEMALFLEVQQKVTNELIENPITFEKIKY